MCNDALQITSQWPKESREAAKIVLEKYGQPDETTDSSLIWFDRDEWKRIIASKTCYTHKFPASHNDSIESFINYRVPPNKFAELARFDGSIVAERTAGEVSARCHDLEANRLALNLMHDIVTGAKSVEQAREYYAEEFLNFRRGKSTPYMDQLQFAIPTSNTADPDESVITADQIAEAKAEGRETETAA